MTAFEPDPDDFWAKFIDRGDTEGDDDDAASSAIGSAIGEAQGVAAGASFLESEWRNRPRKKRRFKFPKLIKVGKATVNRAHVKSATVRRR
jgi:hypothetical protein